MDTDLRVERVRKVKAKFFPDHNTKSYTRSRAIGPLILKLGTGWRSVVNFTPRPSYPTERILVNSE
jgi:hypothetical protein